MIIENFLSWIMYFNKSVWMRTAHRKMTEEKVVWIWTLWIGLRWDGINHKLKQRTETTEYTNVSLEIESFMH